MKNNRRTRSRDLALRSELLDALKHDVRTRRVTLDIVVDGGVAHMHGEVPNDALRTIVARLTRRIDGIYAVWDFVTIPGQQLRVLDVGCGSNKQVPEAIGIDICRHAEVDIVADLEHGIPLPDAYADHILAIHVIEHLDNLLGLMDEMHRVLRPGGTLHVMTPDRRAVNAIADPTHRRYIDVQTFKYFCEPHGHRLWEPLKVTSDGTTVFADLRPSHAAAQKAAPGLARWFA